MIKTILIVLLLLTGCSPHLYPKDYNHAEEVCKNNQGVEGLVIHLGEYDIFCKNNAIFAGNKKER